MRDSQVINELHNVKKRNAIVYRQMVFCNTRMQAFEKILIANGFWSRLFLIVWPSAFMAAVDKAHQVFLQEHDDALRAAEQAPAPQKLSVVQNGEIQEVKFNGRR